MKKKYVQLFDDIIKLKLFKINFDLTIIKKNKSKFSNKNSNKK